MRGLALLMTGVFAYAGEIANPAGAGSGPVFLAASSDGKAYLSWVEKGAGKRHELRWSVRQGDSWSAPATIAGGENWFINWADFPSLVPLEGGVLAAHWLERDGADPYAYNLRLVLSKDEGKTWTKPWQPAARSPKQYTGFVSIGGKDGRVSVLYLAPGPAPKHATPGDEHHITTLRMAELSTAGRLLADDQIDADVCSCCQTTLAWTSDGPVVAYRDHAAGEIRDIGVMVRRTGKWSTPKPVHADGWKINACPVNGPAAAAAGKQVALAWFTAANQQRRVKLAFSTDAGTRFGAPITIDDGNPEGRVDTLLLPDGDALVAWLERSSEGKAEVRMRRVTQQGKASKSATIARVSSQRSSGFPHLALAGGKLLAAWKDDRVKTAELEIPAKP